MKTDNFLHNQENIHPHLGRGKRRRESIFPKCDNNVKMKLFALLYSAKRERERGEISEVGEGKSNSLEHEYSHLQYS